MKVRADTAPPGAFSIDPARNGMCLVRLYQNPHEYTETREGQTETGWEYDEYHIHQVWWNGLEENIEANYQVFLDAAKEAEIDKSNAALYAAQETTDTFVFSDQYMHWDGLKWVFDPENPIPLLRLPFANGIPNAFYRFTDGKRYVYAFEDRGPITEDNFNEVMELWDIDNGESEGE